MAPLRLLDLPPEVVEIVILNLEPREAIYLSLTCRQLYYGLLSPRNSRLWYLIGNFASGSLPGHNPRWPASTVWLPEHTPPRASVLSAHQLILERYLGVNAHRLPAPVYISQEELRDLVKKFPVEAGKPVVDYKRLLLDTMRGLTETGCQWCLSKPDTNRDYLFPVLKGRVCEDCFRFNAIRKIYFPLCDKALTIAFSDQSPGAYPCSHRVPCVQSSTMSQQRKLL